MSVACHNGVALPHSDTWIDSSSSNVETSPPVKVYLCTPSEWRRARRRAVHCTAHSLPVALSNESLTTHGPPGDRLRRSAYLSSANTLCGAVAFESHFFGHDGESWRTVCSATSPAHGHRSQTSTHRNRGPWQQTCTAGQPGAFSAGYGSAPVGPWWWQCGSEKRLQKPARGALP